jgi:hypothetical protein
MSVFQTDGVLQDYIDIIFKENGTNNIIAACDYYHNTFPSQQQALEWGLCFGEYIGKYLYDSCVWSFELPDKKTIVYFFGSRDIVKEKIYNLL